MQFRINKLFLSSALACLAASTGWAQVGTYSQDFEGLDITNPAALGDDGWLVGANVFDPNGNYLYNYFAFPAPNGGPAFSAIVPDGQGAGQGAQSIVVYNDYNNGDHNFGNLIEANFFRETTVDASDVGKTMVFSFDGAYRDLVSPTTAAAFIKVIDTNTWGLSEYQAIDTTNLPAAWDTYTISTEIRPDQVGHLFQIGFMNTTSFYTGAGVLYDNISLSEAVAGPDECSGATAISGDGVYAFDATSATTGAEGQNEALCYNFGSSAIENDVWFEWTCAADGTVTVSTCDDASADTRLAAYDGAGCPSDGSAIACNDDASGCSGFTSVISFAGTSGSVYMIQVGHFPGTAGGTGNITVTTTAPPTGPNPDNCDEATAIAGDGVYAFDATSATTGAEGQNEALCYSFGSSAVVNDVWFEWTSDTDGTVNVSTCGDASADTRIAAYAGAGCPSAGSAIACNDDAPGCAGFTSAMDFACTSGSVYMIQVGHFPGTAGGTGNITVTQTAAPTGPGTAYCFGDGSATACPCGNAGSSDSGCANSTGSGGSLAASGDASLSADTVVLEASGLVPNLPCLFFSGKNQVAGGNGIVFGDGLRCAGFEAVRLEVTVSDASGAVSSSVGLSGAGATSIADGETVNYQGWYRDDVSSSPCGNSFNTTNAYSIVWGA